MRTRSFHRLTPLAVVAIATMMASAACASTSAPALPEPPVAATPTTPGTSAPSTSAPSPSAPNTAPATTTPNQPACLGAVVHTVDASAGGRPWRSLCIAVGGLLRLANLGPEYLNASSWDKVDCNYEGGVHACRLIHTGTVKFAITNTHGTRPLTVVVARAASPPKPSPACTTTMPYPIDASSGGPPLLAECVRIGAVLRVENLGPEGFTVTPRNLASCWYEAAVRECTFVKAGTVTFTMRFSPDWEPRTLTVVVIR
jgi:hypothetical protein